MFLSFLQSGDISNLSFLMEKIAIFEKGFCSSLFSQIILNVFLKHNTSSIC